MSKDPSRQAAVTAALAYVDRDLTLGLGSGRAVFALTEALGNLQGLHLRAVVASPATRQLAIQAGIEVVELNGSRELDIAFDGADEVDSELRMIKGGGAAALREKLVLAAARQTVILVEEPKVVDRLGLTRRLPVDIAAFGWEKTLQRVEQLAPDCILRKTDDGTPAQTAEGNYLLDVSVPSGDLSVLASSLKATLGVVEHGLFLTEADVVIVGHPDGSASTLTRG